MQIRGSLSPRLEAVISLVRQGAVTADIGCDHAFVSIELIKRNISEYAYLCDVRTGPLQAADSNVNDHCVKNNVKKDSFFKLILSDGLQELENIEPAPTDVIIAGMGGELIARIMTDSKYSRVNGIRFILQPMTSQYELRKYLAKNGIEILTERYVKEDGKIYQIMLCEYTGEIYEPSDGEAEAGSPRRVCETDREQYNSLIERKVDKLKKIAALKAASGNDIGNETNMIKELSGLKF